MIIGYSTFLAIDNTFPGSFYYVTCKSKNFIFIIALWVNFVSDAPIILFMCFFEKLAKNLFVSVMIRMSCSSGSRKRPRVIAFLNPS